MTDPQMIAMAFPCTEAEQCAQLRYKNYSHDLRWSLILTMNVGFE